MNRISAIAFFLFFSLCSFAQKGSTITVQKDWRTSFNQQADLQDFYNAESGLFVNGVLYISSAQISEQLNALQKEWGKFSDYQTQELVQIAKQQKIEHGTYTTANGQRYATLIAWQMKNHWVKALEVIYPATEKEANKGMIQKLTQAWEERSNRQQPAQLVEELYGNEGYYFNQGQVYQGAAITERYAYMKNANWKIDLESNLAVACDQDILLNVGTYTSNGQGLYILVWQKTKKGYQILLDFNY